MKCPKCGLINPDTALRCDCGYDFAAKEMRESFVAAAENAKAGSERNRRFGRFASGHTCAQFGVLAYAFKVLLSLAGIAFELLQIALLLRSDGSYYITTAEAEAVSILEALGALLDGVFFFLTGFAFLLWVYRAYLVARSFNSGTGVDNLLGARWVILGSELLTLTSAILAIYIVARTDEHQEQLSRGRVQATLAAR